MAVLRQILHEIDDKISPGDLDLMIEEIDADGSGTVDFEGIFEMKSNRKIFLTFFFLCCRIYGSDDRLNE